MKGVNKAVQWIFLGMLFVIVPTAWAQQKQPLDHDVYDFWNRIDEQKISPDGKWILYSLGPEEGDAVLQLKSLSSNRTYEVARGVSGQFSADSRLAAFLIRPALADRRQAKRDGKKDDDVPKDSLGLYDLASGEKTLMACVKSFRFPEEGGGWMAYHLEKTKAVKDTTRTAKDTTQAVSKEKPAPKNNKKKKKDPGTPLILRNLTAGTETRFEDVTSYAFTQDGTWLVYTASTQDGNGDGVFAVATASGQATPLMTGKGVYKQVALDEPGTRVAFLSNRDDYEADQPGFTLYQGTLGADSVQVLAAEGMADLPERWWVSEHGSLSFSKTGSRLFFGTAPRPAPEDTTKLLDEEKVVLDVWSWHDVRIQPEQLDALQNDLRRSYLAVADLATGRLVQLGDELVSQVSLDEDGEASIVLGLAHTPYERESSWDYPSYYDVYVIDLATGSRRQVMNRLQARPRLSPEARYLYWWDGTEQAWYARDVQGGTPVNMTAQIPYPLQDEFNDRPHIPSSQGSAGWTPGDEALVVYDEHDLWAVDPTGTRPPRNITEGVGRQENLRFRYVQLDPEAQAIDPQAPLLLSAFDRKTKAGGYYRDQFAGAEKPVRLLMMEREFSFKEKAKEADVLVYTRESFQEFPDLWVSDRSFRTPKQVSQANPQQANYLWGTVEMVHWTSLEGEPLDGLLFKPEGFDPSKKYPMMVNFYERNSDGLHSHRAPAPGRTSINITFYVSRGYLVFIPDIPYKIGYPGESAMNAVMPGITSLISTGFVDDKRIGVQGHSWGGYQIAYMVTETNLFAAAEAGAPVVNMISAYGGIRWGSGVSRMFQYERTQSRIAGSLWEYPLRYIDNSPIFQADKVQTPLLMLHNDQDDAVPWYQGIEFFLALRRLDKPVWMLNYNGERHWIWKYRQKVDFAIRMQQFFDHYLKGAPAPVWMEEGIPAIQKGKNLGLEPARGLSKIPDTINR